MGVSIRSTTLFNSANLKGYWELEGLNDSSSSGYTLTADNAPTNGAAVFNNGYTFVAGSSQRLKTSTSATALNTTGSQTWIYWTKPTVASGRAGAMSIYESGVGERKLWIEGALNVYARISGLSVETIDGGTVTTGVAHMLAMVYNASTNVFRVFVDGVRIVNQSVTGTPTALSVNQMTFANDNGTSYHSCQMDDCAFFDTATTN